MGVHKGIATRLEVPAIHCGGHKTNLTPTHMEAQVVRVTLLADHLRGIATDLWASSKRNEKFRTLQIVHGEKAREFIWAPKTRWLEIRKVVDRYITLIGSLDEFYEDLAVSDGEFARGRLANIRDVRYSMRVFFANFLCISRYLYLSHVLVDFLLPIQILNKKQQADETLICELGSGVANVLKYLENLEDGEPSESEQEFWNRFNQSTMVYVAGAHVLNLKWVAGAVLRVRTHKGVLENLQADRKMVLDTLIEDFKTYYPKDPWQVFDLLSFPEGNMGDYGITEITSLYNKYSSECKVLAVQDEKDGKGSTDGKKILVTVKKVLLPSDSKTKIISGQFHSLCHYLLRVV
jgi:hypothetical protein